MSNEATKNPDTKELLVAILGAMLNGSGDNAKITENLTRDAVNAVAALAKQHDLAHIIARFVEQNGVEIDAELRAKLQREDYMSVYRNRQMEYALSEICAAFDRAEIPYIPLKGSVLRKYYPYESMRTSCDVDVLIHERDIDAAVSALTEKGYTVGKRNYHDVSLYSPNKIHLELHFSIQENIESLDSVLKNAWDYAKPTEGFRYEFSGDFLVYHIFAHMNYHFLSGGCGVRSLMDIWVMEEKMGISYVTARELLEKAGIYKFAAEMRDIAYKALSGEELNGLSKSIFQYIYSGGVYGNSENKLAVYKSEDKGTFSYIIHRIFMPYRAMCMLFPILKKAPILLPAFWVVRLVRAVFKGKSKNFANQISVSSNMSDEKVREVSDIRSYLEI